VGVALGETLGTLVGVALGETLGMTVGTALGTEVGGRLKVGPELG